MLNCKDCEYFRVLNGRTSTDKPIVKCAFSGYVFKDDWENLDMDYPCTTTSYDQYMSGEDRKKFGRIFGEDWKLMYAKNHPKVAAPDRLH